MSDWNFVEGEVLDSEHEKPDAETVSSLPKDEKQWEEVSIPHVFRQSGLPDNGAGWYRCQVEARPEERRWFLHLEGAASVADVFVNGNNVGRHRGAYTAATFDLTPALKKDARNELLVRVSNGDLEARNALSHSTLYVTNGGLFRPAWLIETGPVHFDPYMGSSGLFLTCYDLGTADIPELGIKVHLRNHLDRDAEVEIRHLISDPVGHPLREVTETITVGAGKGQSHETLVAIPEPERWGIRDPKLYTVRSVLSVDGKPMDEVTERTGFRTIAMEDGRFMLNGGELLVRGVNKHQQTEKEWNAIPERELRREWDLMDGLGVNTVRLAHYPHRRFEYHQADERGIAVWAENGLAGQLWQHEVKRDSGEREPTADGGRITREMVFQNWNHPSILFWSSGNETHEKVAARYAEIIRGEDSSRLVTYASAHNDRPDTVDFIAGNTYQGWYEGHFSGFGELPRNKYVSETGAGTWLSHHIPHNQARWKVNEFEPVEYGNLFAEYRVQSVFRDRREGHKMYLWWNFREFYDRKFKDNRNTKGMLTLAGTPKDVYHLHRMFLRPDLPQLRIASRHHFYRTVPPGDGIKVYSNAETVELFINGRSRGVARNGEYRQPLSVFPKDWKNAEGKRVGPRIENVFFWRTPLAPGRNVIEARGNNGRKDTVIIYQKGGPAENGLVVDLESGNPENPAVFIDRPVEPQAPFYLDVDGSSDNTFDGIPEAIRGASWISTRRLSDPRFKTDLSFTLAKDADVFVMHSTGTFPPMVLREPEAARVEAAAKLGERLGELGFTRSEEPAIWRGHDLWLADAAVWSRTVRKGERIELPGQVLDYVVLVRD